MTASRVTTFTNAPGVSRQSSRGVVPMRRYPWVTVILIVAIAP